MTGTISMQIRTRRGWTTITLNDLMSDANLYPDKISGDDKETVIAKAHELGFEGDVVQYVNSKTQKPFYVCYAEAGSRLSPDVDLTVFASRRK